jgi:hypothetical protein
MLKTQELYEATYEAQARPEDDNDKGPTFDADTTGIKGMSAFRKALPYWRALRGDERSAAPDLMHIIANVVGLFLSMIHGDGFTASDADLPSYVLPNCLLRVARARMQSLKLPPGVSAVLQKMFGARGEKRKSGKSIDKMHLVILQLLPFAIVGLMPDGRAPGRLRAPLLTCSPQHVPQPMVMPSCMQ